MTTERLSRFARRVTGASSGGPEGRSDPAVDEDLLLFLREDTGAHGALREVDKEGSARSV